jgi:hypothetical protein
MSFVGTGTCDKRVESIHICNRLDSLLVRDQDGAALGNDRIQIFSPTGEFIRSIGREGSEEGSFCCPIGVCAMDGNIIVTEYGNNRIQIVSPTGEFIRTFGLIGDANGRLDGPAGVCILEGNIVVADELNHRIQIFSPTGDFIRSIGKHGTGNGDFHSPNGVCSLAGNLCVADTANNRVQLFSSIGDFIWAYPVDGSPLNVSVADGNIVVSIGSDYGIKSNPLKICYLS